MIITICAKTLIIMSFIFIHFDPTYRIAVSTTKVNNLANINEMNSCSNSILLLHLVLNTNILLRIYIEITTIIHDIMLLSIIPKFKYLNTAYDMILITVPKPPVIR